MARGEIGFVGLGIMGKPMVRNLLKADYSVTVYDIVAESVEELASEGAKPASSRSEERRVGKECRSRWSP